MFLLPCPCLRVYTCYSYSERSKQTKERFNMNYNTLKLSFIIGMAITGILICNIAYSTMTNVITNQNARLESIYNF